MHRFIVYFGISISLFFQSCKQRQNNESTTVGKDDMVVKSLREKFQNSWKNRAQRNPSASMLTNHPWQCILHYARTAENHNSEVLRVLFSPAESNSLQVRTAGLSSPYLGAPYKNVVEELKSSTSGGSLVSSSSFGWVGDLSTNTKNTVLLVGGDGKSLIFESHDSLSIEGANAQDSLSSISNPQSWARFYGSCVPYKN